MRLMKDPHQLFHSDWSVVSAGAVHTVADTSTAEMLRDAVGLGPTAVLERVG